MKEFQPTNEQLGSLCGALAYLVGAGIGTGDALNLLRQDEQEPALGAVLAAMADRADSGAPLAELFSQAGCFPGYLCTLLTVGEQVGQVEQTLSALAAHYDSRGRMNRRLKAALTYPAALLGVLLAVIVILLVWVLPVFEDVYAQLGAQLTGLAGVLLALGKGLGRALPWLCLVLAAAAAVAAVPAVRRKIMALVGDRGVFARLNDARFVQALSLGISSGMTDREAVALAATLANVPGFAERCAACASAVEKGEALPQALQKAGFVSRSDCRLLEAGNRSGHGEQALAAIAGQLLEGSEDALEQAVGKIEPAMVSVACLLIGAVLLSVMLPLMNILNAIG